MEAAHGPQDQMVEVILFRRKIVEELFPGKAVFERFFVVVGLGEEGVEDAEVIVVAITGLPPGKQAEVAFFRG